MRTDKEVLEGHYGKPVSKIEGKIKEFEITIRIRGSIRGCMRCAGWMQR